MGDDFRGVFHLARGPVVGQQTGGKLFNVVAFLGAVKGDQQIKPLGLLQHLSRSLCQDSVGEFQRLRRGRCEILFDPQ